MKYSFVPAINVPKANVCARCGDHQAKPGSWYGVGDVTTNGDVPNGGMGSCGDMHEWEVVIEVETPQAPWPMTNALPASILADMGTVGIERLDPMFVAEAVKAGLIASAIGHLDTALLVSEQLGVEVVAVRRTVTPDEARGGFIAALYEGPRLPEGSKTLPEGASLKFYAVGSAWIREGYSTAVGIASAARHGGSPRVWEAIY